MCSPNLVNALPENYYRPAAAPENTPVGTSFSFLNTSAAPFSKYQNCTFVSFDTRFDAILGSDPELTVLGGVTKDIPYAFEGPSYLHGECY